jgi:uncharacterized membrane protein
VQGSVFSLKGIITTVGIPDFVRTSMKEELNMFRAAAIAAALAGSLAMSGGSLAQTNNAYRSAEAVAGKPHRIGAYGNVQKDCTSGPLPTIKVLTPPKHGELNVRSGTLKTGRITRCPSLAAKAQGIFYKANPTYKGGDEVAYEVRSASGKVESHTVRITVKDASQSGTTPNADEELAL